MSKQNEYSRVEECRSILKDWETILNKPNINLSQVRLWNFSDCFGRSRCGTSFQSLTIQDREGRNLIDPEVDREILNLIESLRLFPLHLIAESLGFKDSLPEGQRVAWHHSLGRFSIILIFDGISHHKDELVIRNIEFIN